MLLITVGLHVPLTPFVEVGGKAGAVAPVQSAVGKLNVGAALAVTVKIIVSVINVPHVFVAVNVIVMV